MPMWLKVTISIIGVLFVVFTKYKIHDTNACDIIMFILWCGFAGLLIFAPWVYK